MPALVNQFLLEHSHVHSFTYRLWLLSHYIDRTDYWERDYTALYFYIYYLTLYQRGKNRQSLFKSIGTRFLRLSLWLSGKEPTCQSKRCKFSSLVGKIPWRRKWQLTPVFLTVKSCGQRSLADYSPWGPKELDTNEWLNNKRNSKGNWKLYY